MCSVPQFLDDFKANLRLSTIFLTGCTVGLLNKALFQLLIPKALTNPAPKSCTIRIQGSMLDAFSQSCIQTAAFRAAIFLEALVRGSGEYGALRSSDCTADPLTFVLCGFLRVSTWSAG